MHALEWAWPSESRAIVGGNFNANLLVAIARLSPRLCWNWELLFLVEMTKS